jgi:hypothetical protein
MLLSVTFVRQVQILTDASTHALLIDFISVVGLGIWQTCHAVTECDILSKGGPKTCLMLT